MPKIVVVVARDRPELFSYFERVFDGMPDIKVLLDRRILPPGSPARRPRRKTSRKPRKDIYDELQQRGFVMIRLED